MTFPSPSKKQVIEIRQTRFANELGIRVDLVTERGTRELYERRRESIIYFVHVYWSPDETKVAMLATGAQGFGLGYDLRAERELPFEDIEEDLGHSIATTYNLLPAQEPIAWASSDEAAGAFFARHPEIKLSYH